MQPFHSQYVIKSRAGTESGEQAEETAARARDDVTGAAGGRTVNGVADAHTSFVFSFYLVRRGVYGNIVLLSQAWSCLVMTKVFNSTIQSVVWPGIFQLRRHTTYSPHTRKQTLRQTA